MLWGRLGKIVLVVDGKNLKNENENFPCKFVFPSFFSALVNLFLICFIVVDIWKSYHRYCFKLIFTHIG